MATTQNPSDIAQRQAGAETPIDVLGSQSTVATGVIGGRIMRAKGLLRGVSAKLLVCGTAGATTVQVRKNGVSAGEVTIDNADPDGTMKTVGINPAVTLAAGDMVDLNVSAAPTAGSGLAAFADIVQDF
jgi:hypothetical protein